MSAVGVNQPHPHSPSQCWSDKSKKDQILCGKGITPGCNLSPRTPCRSCQLIPESLSLWISCPALFCILHVLRSSPEVPPDFLTSQTLPLRSQNKMDRPTVWSLSVRVRLCIPVCATQWYCRVLHSLPVFLGSAVCLCIPTFPSLR